MITTKIALVKVKGNKTAMIMNVLMLGQVIVDGYQIGTVELDDKGDPIASTAKAVNCNCGNCSSHGNQSSELILPS